MDKESIPFIKSGAKKQIELLVKGRNKSAINGIEELKVAIQEDNIRGGDILFGTSTITHALGLDGDETQKQKFKKVAAGFLDICPSMNAFLATGQWRKYAYLHVAIYAGYVCRCSKCNLFYRGLDWFNDIANPCPKCKSRNPGKHYVIQVGGMYHGDVGMVTAIPLEDAFTKDAEFISFMPRNFNMNLLILQRVLACLGLYYHYDMAAVSCEIFAISMMKLTRQFEPIQVNVLNCVKMLMGPPEAEKYDKFYADIIKRLKKIESSNFLTLDSYLNNINQNELITRIVDGLKQGYGAHDLNTQDAWFQDPSMYISEVKPTITRYNTLDICCRTQFCYIWLNPYDEDAPAQLELHLKIESKNLSVEKITRDAINALSWGFEKIFLVLFNKGNQLGSDWNTKDDFGFTALMYACKHGMDEIVKILLQDPGIDVNAENKYGYTALHLECHRHGLNIVSACHTSGFNIVEALVFYEKRFLNVKMLSMLFQDPRTKFRTGPFCRQQRE